MVTAALFCFLFAWGDFLFALTLTTTEDVRPVTLGLYTYIGAFVADWSSVMATAMMASVPAVVLLVIAQRYVAAGTTTGAVKYGPARDHTHVQILEGDAVTVFNRDGDAIEVHHHHEVPPRRAVGARQRARARGPARDAAQRRRRAAAAAARQ